MPRRRKYSKRSNRAPGKSFWLRPPVFDVDLKSSASGVYSEILLTESDFSDPSLALNDTSRGAPVIERTVVTAGYDQVVSENYFNVASFGQVTMIVECMLYTQSDQFVSIVTGDQSFDLALENERILGYEIMKWDMTSGVLFNSATVTAPRHQIRCRFKFEPRSRVKIREKSVAIAIRTNMDEQNSSIQATFPWVQPTFLVRVP